MDQCSTIPKSTATATPTSTDTDALITPQAVSIVDGQVVLEQHVEKSEHKSSSSSKSKAKADVKKSDAEASSKKNKAHSNSDAVDVKTHAKSDAVDVKTHSKSDVDATDAPKRSKDKSKSKSKDKGKEKSKKKGKSKPTQRSEDASEADAESEHEKKKTEKAKHEKQHEKQHDKSEKSDKKKPSSAHSHGDDLTHKHAKHITWLAQQPASEMTVAYTAPAHTLRMHHSLDALLPGTRNDSWLCVADTMYGAATVHLASQHVARVLALDNADAALASAWNAGHVPQYATEPHLDRMRFPDARFDVALTELTLWTLERPYAIVHEMLRVSKHGVVLIELHDQALPTAPAAGSAADGDSNADAMLSPADLPVPPLSSAATSLLSASELVKVAIQQQLHYIAFKTLPRAAAAVLTTAPNLPSVPEQAHLIAALMWREQPTAALREALQLAGYREVRLPEHQHRTPQEAE